MKLRLLKQKKIFAPLHFMLLLMPAVLFSSSLFAQAPAVGSWTPVASTAPNANGGVMLVLSDGSVICKNFAGGGDGYGNSWDRLTPDASGSYANGTWSSIAAMHKTRLYFSSQVLKDGRVYVAGGEYGTGTSAGEVYDPLTDVWTNTPTAPSPIYDGNSEILNNGTVLQAYQGSQVITRIYDPATNTYAVGPNVHGSYDEAAWVKLADGSILYIDINSTNSERYIPSTNTWVVDGTVPVSVYDPYGEEAGAGILLPDGRVFFLGSTGHCAYYTPSGTSSPGTFTAGPDIPGHRGTPDAAAAMMVNGKILCTVSPVPTSANHFPAPTSFYEFDYLTNTFTRISAPAGGNTENISCYVTNMVDLPDGTVLYSEQNSSQYYIYKPAGAQLVAGKPKVNKTIHNMGDGSYRITGTLFNGISEGAGYGDDWQMETNYPIVRLTSGTNVYYARSFNWNSTGVQRGSAPDTAYFTLPAGIPSGSYKLTVSANGIKSANVTFIVGPVAGKAVAPPVTSANVENKLSIYPNPAKDHATLQFSLAQSSHINVSIFDAKGNRVKDVANSDLEKGDHSLNINTSQLAKGIYMVKLATETGVKTETLVVE